MVESTRAGAAWDGGGSIGDENEKAALPGWRLSSVSTRHSQTYLDKGQIQGMRKWV